jgi:predicted anti-sigma-YlaC factor YlaD
VNPGPDCERARYQLIAALDGETFAAADPRADAQQHLASCASCGQWRQDLEAMNRRFHGVSYPGAHVDLCAVV